MEKAALLVRVKGLVQGVGYRYFTYREATALEVTGYVKNLVDGRVEVYAEGRKDHLEQLLSRLRQGPRFGHVADAEVEWDTYRGKYRKFVIDTGYGF